MSMASGPVQVVDRPSAQGTSPDRGRHLLHHCHIATVSSPGCDSSSSDIFGVMAKSTLSLARWPPIARGTWGRDILLLVRRRHRAGSLGGAGPTTQVLGATKTQPALRLKLPWPAHLFGAFCWPLPSPVHGLAPLSVPPGTVEGGPKVRSTSKLPQAVVFQARVESTSEPLPSA